MIREYLPEVIIGGLIIGLIVLLGWAAVHEQEQKTAPETYAAWCKATSTTNLTYEEWAMLVKRKMLPGQQPENIYVPMPIPISTR